MAVACVYPYPFTAYVPDPHEVTNVQKTFPEHHFPLEETRHKLSKGVHNYFNDTIKGPRADIRETLKNYYIDVELPGISNDGDLDLEWTNASTLLVKAIKARLPVPEDSQPASEQTVEQGHKHAKKHVEHPVHTLTHERDLGPVIRSFSFQVRVDRTKMQASLQYGLLRIVVPKTTEVMAHSEEAAAPNASPEVAVREMSNVTA